MILAQKNLESTSDVVILKNRVKTVVRSIILCNVTTSNVTYRIYRKKGSSGFSTSNALFYDVTLPASSTEIIDFPEGSFVLSANNETIAARCSSASSLTITIDGESL